MLAGIYSIIVLFEALKRIGLSPIGAYSRGGDLLMKITEWETIVLPFKIVRPVCKNDIDR